MGSARAHSVCLTTHTFGPPFQHQKMAERHEAEMEALVTQEKEVADLLEARAAEVKQVRS